MGTRSQPAIVRRPRAILPFDRKTDANQVSAILQRQTDATWFWATLPFDRKTEANQAWVTLLSEPESDATWFWAILPFDQKTEGNQTWAMPQREGNAAVLWALVPFQRQNLLRVIVRHLRQSDKAHGAVRQNHTDLQNGITKTQSRGDWEV
jgi:hypothetical protein